MISNKMKFMKAPLILLFVLFITCSQTIKIKKINNDFITHSDIDKTVIALMDAASATGLCLAILNDNKVAFLQAYGFNNKEKNILLDKNTIMLGASFSKAVFAYIVMQLVQEGVFDLDRPLYKYLDKPLPEYDNYKDLSSDKRIGGIDMAKNDFSLNPN